MKSQRGFAGVHIAGIVVVFALVAGALTMAQYGTKETVTVTVTGKERVTSNDGNGNITSKYLIFTESETFENTDALFAGKFNSSDFYGKIRENQTCDFTVIGWRVPFLSMYRNIIGMECK